MDVVAAAMNLPVNPDLDLDAVEDAEQNLSNRISNWVRFTVDRNWPSARCRSIEGRYRPERLPGDEETDRRTAKRTQADIDAAMRDAWQTEDAWKELPDIYRFCLQFTYLKGDFTRAGYWKPWDSRKVWRKLGPYRGQLRKWRDYDEVLRMSRFALMNQLRRRKHR